MYLLIKTIVSNNTSKPFMRKETKDLIKQKNEAYKSYKISGNVDEVNDYKTLTKNVKKAIGKDRTDWPTDELLPQTSTKTAWNKAKEILGTAKCLNPKSIKLNNDVITNPKKISDAYANFHYQKLQRLRRKYLKIPKINPISCLKDWMRKA